MINAKDSHLKAALNRANPNALPDAFRKLGLGDVVRALPVYLRTLNPVAAGTSPYSLATMNTIVLPEDAKAAYILRATAKAGQTGEMDIKQYGTDPSGNDDVGVSPNGDLVFFAAGAATDVDVLYVPEKGDVVEVTLPMTSAHTLLLPAELGAAVLLLEAEATKGTATGKKIILKPGAQTTTDGTCNLSLDKKSVLFDATDAVTEARVKLLVKSAIDVSTLLGSDTGII